jgi:archaellum biogenesis ATPase FlaH
MLAGDFIEYVNKLPHQEDLIEAILPYNEVMIICGAPFKGKSLEAQRLACQFPSGGTYHGLKVEPCEAAYITWEGSPTKIGRRFKSFIKNVPLEKHPVIHKLDTPTYLNTPEGYEAFIKVITDIRIIRNIKVIIVDSFSYTIDGDYKTDAIVNRWWEAVQKLSNTLELTFIFVWEFTKPIIFRGEEVNPYDLSRLKSAYTTAYKVNTVVAMGEISNVVKVGGKPQRIKTPQIVIMKAKDSEQFPPLAVTLNKNTLCYDGEIWQFDKTSDGYIVVPSNNI